MNIDHLLQAKSQAHPVPINDHLLQCKKLLVCHGKPLDCFYTKPKLCSVLELLRLVGIVYQDVANFLG
ncbi:MAG: hypothetical protein GX226_05105 [Dehalococcoidales bacterium]|nr:hypothetical protein [Dehalococcoidales bacterium]